jgi:hypothetical protein
MNQNMRRRPHRPQGVRPSAGQGRPARQPQNGAGSAHRNYERYVALARDAQRSGDVIEMENCYQHAEHYFRVMRGGGDERRD